MPRIVAIGDFNEDLLMEVDGLPGLDSQAVARCTTSSGGGCAANFAVACSKLGVEAALHAVVGDDHRGRWLMERAEAAGVDVSGVHVLAGVPTGITVSLSCHGTRTMLSSPGSNAHYNGSGFDIPNVRADWVHLTSYFLLPGLRPVMPAIIEELSNRKIPVSFDPGWHHGELNEKDIAVVCSLLSRVELFCPNMREARAYLSAPDDDAERLARKGVKAGAGVCCVTLGDGGCVACRGDELVGVPAVKVPVIDSCGAGDVFAAGFAVSYLSGADLTGCTRFANATAALSLRGAGWDFYPMAEEVKELLSR